MFRGFTLTTMLALAALEPIVAAPEPDLLRYSITQGGLFGIALVLLWYIRSVHQERIASKDATIQVLVTLVSDVKVALTLTADAVAAQAKTLDRIDSRRHVDR